MKILIVSTLLIVHVPSFGGAMRGLYDHMWDANNETEIGCVLQLGLDSPSKEDACERDAKFYKEQAEERGFLLETRCVYEEGRCVYYLKLKKTEVTS